MSLSFYQLLLVLWAWYHVFDCVLTNCWQLQRWWKSKSCKISFFWMITVQQLDVFWKFHPWCFREAVSCQFYPLNFLKAVTQKLCCERQFIAMLISVERRYHQCSNCDHRVTDRLLVFSRSQSANWVHVDLLYIKCFGVKTFCVPLHSFTCSTMRDCWFVLIVTTQKFMCHIWSKDMTTWILIMIFMINILGWFAP